MFATGNRWSEPFATDVLDATEGDLYAVKELLGHCIHTGDGGLSALVADADGERRQGADRIPALEPSNRRALKTA